ncbi:hypothetical protein DRP53_04690 [candidate division WOR-3 bacterium]|uniref:Uncharacterized protein n=1 Tax=candidate division WOR-3 bacterium TaxID=2052148 RepID=A0A660SJ27_UNCW3|nr:MAG: hypothetical protein DRP53_04690 [candidate division WOR-3 bacterium]
MSVLLSLTLSLFGQLRLRDVVIYGLLRGEVSHERSSFFPYQSRYETSEFLDFGSGRDLEKKTVQFENPPLIRIGTKLGTAPSGGITGEVQSSPSVYFNYYRTRNPVHYDRTSLRIYESGYGCVSFEHEYLSRHFTYLSGRFKFGRFAIRASQCWFGEEQQFILSPTIRYDYRDLTAIGRIDLTTPFFAHLRFSYHLRPLTIGLSWNNPLLFSPEVLLSIPPVDLYLRSGVKPWYLDDLYRCDHYLKTISSRRERLRLDIGCQFKLLRFGYSYYDSLPIITTHDSLLMRKIGFGYGEVMGRVREFWLKGRVELRNDLRDRNWVEWECGYHYHLHPWEIQPELMFYCRDRLSYRFDLKFGLKVFELIDIHLGIINLFDTEYIEPLGHLAPEREIFLQIGATF